MVRVLRYPRFARKCCFLVRLHEEGCLHVDGGQYAVEKDRDAKRDRYLILPNSWRISKWEKRYLLQALPVL